MVTDTVRRHGNAPFKVAVIHGGPCAQGSVAPIAHELASDRGVLEPSQSADSVDGQVEELKAQLEAEAGLPATLIGHSWGAWLAWIFAARYPEMVSKLILVGSGPFEAHYAESIMPTRASRVPPENRDEVYSLMERIENPEVGDKDHIVARLGDLLSKTDHFDPVRLDLAIPDCGLRFLPDVHAKVWSEASALRRSGKLLEMAKDIRCPVVAIHGDYDPHPAEGVRRPLSAVLSDFRFILLANCGHEPWIERQARDQFFDILRRELGG